MLNLKGVFKSYGQGTQCRNILNDINLTFVEGEIVFVVGKSGCGKSTLLNLIGGLDSVDIGSIEFDGNLITHQDVNYKKKNVSFVFQDFNLIGGLTIFQNIALSKRDIDNNWINQNVTNLGLDSKYKSQNLSGGEKQRVALLRALHRDTKIILLDEPTGSLDQSCSQKIFGEISKLKNQGKIIIIVTHDLENAQRYGDRIVELREGRVESDIRTEQNIATTQSTTECVTIDMSDINILSNKPVDKPKRFFASLVVANNSVTRHWFRSLSFAIIFMFCITLLSMAISQSQFGHKMSDFVASRFDSDLVRANIGHNGDVSNDNIYVGSNWSINQQHIESISNMSQTNAVVPIYTSTQAIGIADIVTPAGQIIWFSTTSDLNGLFNQALFDKLKFSTVKIVGDESFFKNKIMSNNTTGQYLSNAREIIIDSNLAKSLFGDDDPIGKKLFAWSSARIGRDSKNNFGSVEVKVVGVNRDKAIGIQDSRFSDGVFDTIVHHDLVKEVEQLNVDPIKQGDSNISMIAYPSESLTFNYSHVEAYTEDLEEGHIPTGMEIAVSGKIRDELSSRFGDDWKDRNYYISFDGNNTYGKLGTYEVVISDVLANEEQQNTISLSDHLVALSNQIVPMSLEIYLKNPSNIEEFRTSINSCIGDARFVLQSNWLDWFASLSDITAQFLMILWILTCIIVSIMFVTLCIMIKLNVIERMYEIAVLRSLGYSSKQVFGILLLELILLAIVGMIGSFVFGWLVRFLLVALNAPSTLMSATFGTTVLATVGILGVGSIALVLSSIGVVVKKVSVLFKRAS